MEQARPDGIVVREFVSGSQDGAAFRQINEAWIRRYFAIEPKDTEILSDPEGRILDPGGSILMAECDGTVAGCVALVPMADGGLELAKMGVADGFQGRGLGHALMEACIARARERGAYRLYLETNAGLAPALHLYESHGFVHLTGEQAPPTRYTRGGTHMELRLRR
jgi:putative acetyltransferase